MNAKVCKKLRKTARSRTIGLSERGYKTRRVAARFTDESFRLAEQVLLDPNSTQGAYKGLKRYFNLNRDYFL